MEKDALGDMGKWWETLAPHYKSLLLGAVGATAGGAALGGLRASRPLDAEEAETKEQRRKEVIHKALLGALIGGGGGAAAGYVPELFKHTPSGPVGATLRWLSNVPSRIYGNAPATTAATVAAMLHTYPRVVGYKKLKDLLKSPGLITGLTADTPDKLDPLLEQLRNWERELAPKSTAGRMFEFTGVPAAYRRMRGKTSLGDLAARSLSRHSPVTPSGFGPIAKGPLRSPIQGLRNTAGTAGLSYLMFKALDNAGRDVYNVTNALE